MSPLLFLAHRIPYPPDKGDKIRSFHMLRHLASRFEVYLGCFGDGGDDSTKIAALRDYCAEVFCLPLARGKLATSAFRALTRNRSLSEAYYYDGRMAKWVAEALWRHDVRHLLVFCSAMAPYVLAHRSGRQLVIDMVDTDSRKWGEYAESANPLLRPLYRSEQRRVGSLEQRAGLAGDTVLFVSKAESESFVALAPHLAARIAIMNNGVDADYFDPALIRESPFAADARPIVFTGVMDYGANADAAAYFARESFPTIQQNHPRAQFWIVGAKPSASVRRLAAEKGIFVTGTVPDVRPYLAHAACAIAPLRIARGVQNKVLEAMAMAKPVVVTPAAFEGIEAIAGRDLLVGDDAPAMAQRVSEVLAGEWDGMGASARAFVLSRHRWPAILETLDEIFLQTLPQPAFQPGQELRRLPVGAV